MLASSFPPKKHLLRLGTLDSGKENPANNAIAMVAAADIELVSDVQHSNLRASTRNFTMASLI
jgi:hypothetical protein